MVRQPLPLPLSLPQSGCSHSWTSHICDTFAEISGIRHTFVDKYLSAVTAIYMFSMEVPTFSNVSR